MKKRYTLRFSPTLVEQPLVSKLVRTYDVDINILNADVASGRGGKLVVELSGSEEALKKSVLWLNQTGIIVSEMVKELNFQQEGCINCGACTAVCSPKALSMEGIGSWSMTPTSVCSAASASRPVRCSCSPYQTSGRHRLCTKSVPTVGGWGSPGFPPSRLR